MKNYWIQKTKLQSHKGSLHRQLGLKPGKKIPSKLLRDISIANIGTKIRGHKVTRLLKRRAILAETLRGLR